MFSILQKHSIDTSRFRLPKMHTILSVSNKIIAVFIFTFISIVILCLWLAFSKQNIYHSECEGYSTCPKLNPKILNIHIISHTHNDLGWIKTFEQYYEDDVSIIIDSVIESLLKDSARKFVFAETAYLWKWWQYQTEKKQQTMKKLVNEGRIEIAGGGWGMNDEATPDYQSIIDQYTWGYRRLNDAFGACGRPKVGWQIDPFGHSREQASIYAQMNLDGMFIGRLDYQYKWMRFRNKIGEFVWEASPNLGKSANLFTSILFNHYGPPPGFCFDIMCAERVPIVDDPNDVNYNVHQRANLLVQYAKRQASSYRTKNILLTMGNNLTYRKAEHWFANLDKLIKYINEKYKGEIQIFYSTPSCYIKSLNNFNITWSTKTDDFLPYANNRHTYWTGFYTSRPTLKYFIRLGNNFLQIAKQLTVLSTLSDSSDLQLFRETMGLMQHHDAITGTEQQHVASDFVKILHSSMISGDILASTAMNKLALKEGFSETYDFFSCLLLNISSCDQSSDSKTFIVTVFNPTSQQLTTFVRVPVQKYMYGVRDFTGNEIITQTVPIPEPVLRIPGRYSSATMELVFKAINISALGYQSFYVYRKGDDFVEFPNDHHTKSIERAVSGEFYNISVDAKGNTLLYISKETKELKISQAFRYYEASENDAFDQTKHASGAYIFRPKQTFTRYLNTTASVQVFKGPLVEEIHVIINNWVSQVVRIYNGYEYIEFDWLVGPVPVNDYTGKEVITRFTSNLNNNNEFYTDSNSREMMKRKVNSRPSWDVWLEEVVSGNYYPITSKISIEDKKQMLRMSVLPDRAQGGSSLRDGEIELMIHRRLLYDDDFGISEALNEIEYGTGIVVKGKHYLVTGTLMDRDDLILQEKELANQLSVKPWLFFTPILKPFQEWNKMYKMKSPGMIKSFPKNVRILTLEPWKDSEVLLRLEHFFEVGETRAHSVTAKIDLRELFSAFTVESIEEMVLSADQPLKDIERLQWKLENDENSQTENVINDRLDVSSDSLVIHLNPMQIRTFILKLLPKAQ